MTKKFVATDFPLLMSGVTTTAAVHQTHISDFGARAVHSYGSDNGELCYALSQPTEMAPGGVDYRHNYFLLSPGR